MAGRRSFSMRIPFRPDRSAATARSIALMPMKGSDEAAEPVDEQVAPQQRGGADRAIGDALQRQRDQRDDDERVEDHRRQDRRLRRGEPHDVERAQGRIGRHEHRRQDREIFGDVVGDGEGRQRAARHQELLADADDLDELGRIGIEIDHVAGLARRLRAGLHGDADVGLGERRRVVGAVAAHGDEAAARLFLADIGELVLGRRLGEEIVDAGFGGDGRGGDRIVARHHHRRDAHGAQVGETRLDVGLHDVLEMHDAEQAPVFADRQRRAARASRPASTA